MLWLAAGHRREVLPAAAFFGGMGGKWAALMDFEGAACVGDEFERCWWDFDGSM